MTDERFRKCHFGPAASQKRQSNHKIEWEWPLRINWMKHSWFWFWLEEVSLLIFVILFFAAWKMRQSSWEIELPENVAHSQDSRRAAPSLLTDRGPVDARAEQGWSAQARGAHRDERRKRHTGWISASVSRCRLFECRLWKSWGFYRLLNFCVWVELKLNWFHFWNPLQCWTRIHLSVFNLRSLLQIWIISSMKVI